MQLQQKNEWLEKDLQRTHYLLEETQENMRFLSAGKERSDQALARQQAQLEAALSQVQMRRDGDGKITKELEKVAVSFLFPRNVWCACVCFAGDSRARCAAP